MSKKDIQLKGGIAKMLGGNVSLQERETPSVDEVPTVETPSEEKTLKSTEELLEELDDETRELLFARRNRKRGRPRKGETPEGKDEKNCCWVVKIDQIKKIQKIALSNGLMIKDVVQAMCAKTIAEYESKNGVIDITSKRKDTQRREPSELF